MARKKKAKPKAEAPCAEAKPSAETEPEAKPAESQSS
jgi:hypothetical protein